VLAYVNRMMYGFFMTEAKVTRDLLERALAREKKAFFEELIILVTPCVLARIKKLLLKRGIGSRGDVDQDARQFCHEVFKVFFLEDGGHHARSWEPERGSFETYAAVFAETRVAGWLRKKTEAPLPDPADLEDAMPMPDSSQTPERIFESRELVEKLLQILRDEFSDLGQRLIELLFVEHREVDEICALMNMTPEAVYKWKSRLLRRMRIIAIQIGGGR